MRVLAALFVVVAVASATSVNWFTAFDLTKEQELAWTAKGCFRGSYVPNLSLLNCGESTPFATLDASVALCVVELKSEDATARQSALATIAAHSDCSELVHQTAQNLIIKNAAHLPQEEYSALCSRDPFRAEANNVLFVPREAIRPQIDIDYTKLRAYHRARNATVDVDPNIQALLNSFSRTNVEANVKWLSTDYSGFNTKITRNSWSTKIGTGGCADATWRCAFNVVEELITAIKRILAETGRDVQGWTVEAVPFSINYCSNIKVTVPSAAGSKLVVVIGAHLDSRNVVSGQAATGAAPGADDNGTGSAVLLEILRTMASGAYEYQEQVHLLWFCGEEQGLLGSDALAKTYSNDKVQVVGMFNNDMIGYTQASSGVTVSFMNRNADTGLTQECQSFSKLYLPTLKVGTTTACCSDQQSFYSYGFKAAGIFETPTSSVVYPDYHTARDAYDNGLINYDQVWQFGQANLACILEYAVPYSPKK